ncbi:MAG: hypothetical protein CVU39_17230 [Chloroflexi bacterium HGW-Chloroflexi-10]|nr:MAG: hypothetical protein CVU39_17230 [Chloroflexi bacterium HGW-Chloroflexi-10]
MSNKASRLLTLIQLLQHKPNQKAADLAVQLGISIRSLHRYFAILDEMGIPIYSERGPNGGFSLVRGYRMPPLMFTPDEAAAIYLGAGMVRELWGQRYAEPAISVLAKLDNVLPDEQLREAAWAKRSLAITGLHQIDPQFLAPTLETLQQASHENHTIEMVYQSIQAIQAAERKIDPYALVIRWGYWYLIGFCHTRQALRSFRVDRIQSVKILTEAFTISQGFNLQRFLETEYTNQPHTRIQLLFNAEAARQTDELRSFWDSMETLSDGSVQVSLNTPDTNWVLQTVLSLGAQVEILSPPELRARLLEWINAIAHRYQD